MHHTVFLSMTSVTSVTSVLGLLVLSAPVHADSLTCEQVASNLVVVDGLLDDWKGVGRTNVGGTDRDVSFELRCAYDDQRVYIAASVRDDYLYRGKKPSTKKDDHLAIAVGALGATASSKKSRNSKRSWQTGQLIVYPGNDKQKRKRTWNRRPLPDWLEAEDSLQRRGWSMELSMPLAKIKGYGKSTSALQAHIEYRDSDYAAKVESKRAFTGQLQLQAAVELYNEFLSATGLSAGDITIDRMVDMDGKPGAERVIAGGDIIGVISDGFSYMKLPVASPSDVRTVKLADLGGQGVYSLLTEYRQHGNGGSRDLVAIWQIGGDALQRVFAFESRKQFEDKVLVNRWSLAPRGKYRKGGRKARTKGVNAHDLVIEVDDRDAKGWDEDSFREIPASDVTSILLPWSDQTSAVYYFEGNAAQGGDPIHGKKRRR